MNPRQLVQAMREALSQARNLISTQAQQLDSLTTEPLGYAVVVKTGNISKFKRPVTLDDFKVGAQVKIKITSFIKEERKEIEDDLLPGTLKLIGKITSTADDDMEIGIIFPNGEHHYFKNENLSLAISNGRQEIVQVRKTLTLSLDGQLCEVIRPAVKMDLRRGTFCIITASTKQIVSIAPTVQYGSMALVKELFDKDFCEVNVDGTDKIVFVGRFGKSIEKGDRVILDPASIIILKNLKKQTKDFSVETAAMNLSWDDIGGLEEAKKLMIELVELPHKNPAMIKHYNRKMPKGVLLYGPPGCGKTMLGKATASALMKIYKGNAQSSGFIYIKGPEILSKFVGSSEETIRSIFERARKHKIDHGYPATIFIDEADAILSKRGSGISSDVEKTIVPMFLTEMNGLEDSGAFIILATNRADVLDPAVIRDGRIDRKIKITRPTKESAEEIFMLNMKNTPISANRCNKQQLASLAVEEIFDKNKILYKLEFEGLTPKDPFTLSKVCNGAMISSVVDRAISAAMQRDIATGKRTGINSDDIKVAVEQIYVENKDLSHSEELDEYVSQVGRKVINLSKFTEISQN